MNDIPKDLQDLIINVTGNVNFQDDDTTLKQKKIATQEVVDQKIAAAINEHCLDSEHPHPTDSYIAEHVIPNKANGLTDSAMTTVKGEAYDFIVASDRYKTLEKAVGANTTRSSQNATDITEIKSDITSLQTSKADSSELSSLSEKVKEIDDKVNSDDFASKQYVQEKCRDVYSNACSYADGLKTGIDSLIEAFHTDLNNYKEKNDEAVAENTKKIETVNLRVNQKLTTTDFGEHFKTEMEGVVSNAPVVGTGLYEDLKEKPDIEGMITTAISVFVPRSEIEEHYALKTELNTKFDTAVDIFTTTSKKYTDNFGSWRLLETVSSVDELPDPNTKGLLVGTIYSVEPEEGDPTFYIFHKYELEESGHWFDLFDFIWQRLSKYHYTKAEEDEVHDSIKQLVIELRSFLLDNYYNKEELDAKFLTVDVALNNLDTRIKLNDNRIAENKTNIGKNTESIKFLGIKILHLWKWVKKTYLTKDEADRRYVSRKMLDDYYIKDEIDAKLNELEEKLRAEIEKVDFKLTEHIEDANKVFEQLHAKDEELKGEIDDLWNDKASKDGVAEAFERVVGERLVKHTEDTGKCIPEIISTVSQVTGYYAGSEDYGYSEEKHMPAPVGDGEIYPVESYKSLFDKFNLDLDGNYDHTDLLLKILQHTGSSIKNDEEFINELEKCIHREYDGDGSIKDVLYKVMHLTGTVYKAGNAIKISTRDGKENVIDALVDDKTVKINEDNNIYTNIDGSTIQYDETTQKVKAVVNAGIATAISSKNKKSNVVDVLVDDKTVKINKDNKITVNIDGNTIQYDEEKGSIKAVLPPASKFTDEETYILKHLAQMTTMRENVLDENGTETVGPFIIKGYSEGNWFATVSNNTVAVSDSDFDIFDTCYLTINRSEEKEAIASLTVKYGELTTTVANVAAHSFVKLKITKSATGIAAEKKEFVCPIS